ncbi:Translin [Gracilariopsis chorda]|uniref:Translin n=1 Tax=Gracilariopsis chorda TaxID=448386 RepID=A0A2V3IJ62_9FLOR|nr:Translin [Gracilariopsis chorda]|eukprot:PXF42099.1 Translin [Gracilariopsis chorda]
MAEVEKVFDSLSDAFAAQEVIRERIRAKRDEADVVIHAAVRSVHALIMTPDLAEGIEVVRKALLQTGPAVKTIEDALPSEPGCIHRYVDFWHQQLQSISMICAIIDALSDGSLTRHDEISTKIGAEIYIPLEHFLGGICQSLAELTRLSRNRVIRQDYETPVQCFRFAENIFDGLKQLNLKNDFLRKKYDGVKYEVNHMENIVYDLSIRSLTSNSKKRPAETDIAPPPQRSNQVKDRMVLSPAMDERENHSESIMTDKSPPGKDSKS